MVAVHATIADPDGATPGNERWNELPGAKLGIVHTPVVESKAVPSSGSGEDTEKDGVSDTLTLMLLLVLLPALESASPKLI